MDLFVHMYDIYGEYRVAPNDRLNALFRDCDFYSRIREFTLDGQVDILPHIFPKDTPRPSRLVSLSITRWPWTTVLSQQTATWGITLRSPDPPIPELLVESSSESLRRLSISACTIDIDNLPILCQLTHLSLTDFSPNLTGYPTVKQLLLILQANPNLEELLLEHGGLEVDDDQDLPFVLFTRLRRLRMTLQIQDMDSLLQHLRITSEVEEIELAVEGHQGLVLETVSSFLNDVVSPRAVQCVEARPVSGFFRPGMKYVRNSDSIQRPNLPHHSSFLELRFEGALELSVFLALEILRDATRLELFHDDLLVSQYLEIFKVAPMFQELVTWVGRECNSVRALLSAQDSQEEVGDNICPSCAPLRNLSYLRIIEADLREGEDISSNEAVILNFVRQRKHLELGLERLELVCCQYVSPDWVDELRRFVPEVFWDGRDGVGEAHLDDSDEDYCPSSRDESESVDSSWETTSWDSDKDSYASSSRLENSGSSEGGTASPESTEWAVGAL